MPTFRDDKGRILAGSEAPNSGKKNARLLGFSISQATRTFLLSPDPDAPRDGSVERNEMLRIWNMMHTAYQIATDPQHKQCVAAMNFLVERGFGAVPKEVSLNTAALQAILGSDMSTEARAYLTQKLIGEDTSYLIPANDEDELEDVEVGRSEIIEN